ncbi:MAG: proteasome subunit beta [Candidatus Nanoarchaeia archaeon]|jgi:proteasome beta subunit|nr:proteasome subunit beta [Candidatus Nanoarchaeia archaeon]|tara:strand:+ start:85733 stop:86422 length:690 start_codon:yes stop_codon:yes gene_type:complete
MERFINILNPVRITGSDNMTKETLQSGTTTLGMVCKEGVVLAADRRATLGGRIVAHKKTQKIAKLNNEMAVTWAGSVSDIQLLTKIIKAQIRLIELRRNKKLKVKEVANMTGSLLYSHIRQFFPGIVAFLLGGKDEEGTYLYELGPDGSILMHDDYVTDGSGMMYAMGVLEANYKKDISINEGVKLAVKSISASIQRDTASGNGIDVYTITKDGVKKVLAKEVNMSISM